MQLCCSEGSGDDGPNEVRTNDYFCWSQDSSDTKFDHGRRSGDSCFEVLEQSNLDGSAPASVLSLLSVGDQLAFRALSAHLLYRGADHPITTLTLVVAGPGVSPAVRLVNSILSDEESSVHEVNFVWANANRSDFQLQAGDVEQLEALHPGRLFVSRILDDGMYSAPGADAATSRDDKVVSAIAPYRRGSMVALLAGVGSEELVARTRSLLAEKGFPEENVLVSTAN